MKLDPEFHAAVSEFLNVRQVAHSTRRILAEGLQAPDEPVHTRGHETLHNASAFLDEAREGFALSFRTRRTHSRDELRFLLNRFWMDWQWLDELGLRALPPEQIERVRGQLLSFWMATVALGVLPQLPAEQVTFPARRYGLAGYADIPVPHGSAELLLRLEEVEQVMRHVQVRPLNAVDHEKIRRTYGFFEASAWLTDQHLGKFTGAEV